MRVGIATDHGGFGLKEELVAHLRDAGHEVMDFGAQTAINTIRTLSIDAVQAAKSSHPGTAMALAPLVSAATAA